MPRSGNLINLESKNQGLWMRNLALSLIEVLLADELDRRAAQLGAYLQRAFWRSESASR